MLRMFYISLMKARKMNFFHVVQGWTTQELLFFIGRKHKITFKKYHSSGTVIELTTYKHKCSTVKFIAETNGHGDWIKWK